jgi:hypothetical protein
VCHPAAYLVVRTIRSGGGLALDCDCICLPLHRGKFQPGCLLTFVCVPQQLKRLAPPDARGAVLGFRFVKWIDIGAGIPPPPEAAVTGSIFPPGPAEA